MRGARTMPRDDWLALFAAHRRRPMDEDGWTYWEAFNFFKGACANRTCLRPVRRGVNPAPNMALIGTVLHRYVPARRALIEVVH